MSLASIQRKHNLAMMKKSSHKMLQICLSPKKAKEDVDLMGYLYAGKLNVIKTHVRSKKR